MMGEGLLSLDVKNALEKIVAHCFYSNRILDRIVSILSVSFVMPITATAIHHNLAHLYPLLADEISDYMADRDSTTIYGATPTGDQKYENYIECLRKALELNLELEKLTKDAILVAQQKGDYTTYVFLQNYLLGLIPITKSILDLVDKAEMYGASNINAMKFDHDFEELHAFGDDD